MIPFLSMMIICFLYMCYTLLYGTCRNRKMKLGYVNNFKIECHCYGCGHCCNMMDLASKYYLDRAQWCNMLCEKQTYVVLSVEVRIWLPCDVSLLWSSIVHG